MQNRCMPTAATSTPSIVPPQDLVEDALSDPAGFLEFHASAAAAYRDRGVHGLAAAVLIFESSNDSIPTHEDVGQRILDSIVERLAAYGQVVRDAAELRPAVRAALQQKIGDVALTYADNGQELIAASMTLAVEQLLGTLDAVRKAVAS